MIIVIVIIMIIITIIILIVLCFLAIAIQTRQTSHASLRPTWAAPSSELKQRVRHETKRRGRGMEKTPRAEQQNIN